MNIRYLKLVEMSNPFIRRRHQTNLSISYASKVESENREMQRIRQEKEKEGEIALYNALYGQNGDIFQKVEELNPRYQNYTTYDNTPINKPIKPTPMPLAPLFYDEKIYHLDSQMKSPQTARIIYPSKKKHEKPETTLEFFKRKPLPKLPIPVSPSVIERQHKTKSSRPAQTSLNNIKSNSPEQTRKVFLNRAQRAREAEIMASNQANVNEPTNIEKRASFLPLHYFDNEEYDKNVNFKVPVCGAALYFFPFDDMLDWKNCNVISYDPPLFTIEWDGRTKQVYRISLRFDFDDQDVFEKRRILAFKWRKYFEDQIYLDTFLRALDIKNLPPPPSKILQNIVKRVGIDMEENDNKTCNEKSIVQSEKGNDENNDHQVQKSNVNKLSDDIIRKMKETMQKLIPIVIEEFYFGEKLANYANDCKNNEKYIKEKDLPIFDFEKQKVFPSSQLEKNRITILKFPSFKPMQKINSKICDLKETISLFSLTDLIQYNKTVHANYIEFFDNEIQKLKDIEKRLLEDDYLQFISEAQKLVLDWPFQTRHDLIKMIDLRVSDMLYEIIIEGFDSFLNSFKENQIKFIVNVSPNLTISNPTEEELVSRGIEYLNVIRNLFDQAKSVLHTGNSSDLCRDVENIDLHYKNVSDDWIKLIHDSFQESDKLLEKVNSDIQDIPLYKLETIDDVFNHNKDKINPSNLSTEIFKKREKNEDLKKLEKTVSDSISSFKKFNDSYQKVIVVHNLAVDFNIFRNFLSNQISSFRSIVCEFISEKVFVLTDNITNQTEQLKTRCQLSPEIIEDWYDRHLLFSNIKSNYNQIDNDISCTMPLFEFLDVFNFESKITVAMAFRLKCDLKNFMDKLPEFLEIERKDLQRLTTAHFNETNSLLQDIQRTFVKIERFNFKTDFDLAPEYLDQLISISGTFCKLTESVKTEQKRDEMISLPIKEYPQMEGIKRDLDLFLPLWRIHKELAEKGEEWMGITFLELSPSSIVSHVKKWEETLKEQYEALKKLVILKETIPDTFGLTNDSPLFEKVDSNDPLFEGKEIVVLNDNHPLLDVIQKIMFRIDYLISHIPIIQHLCNPVLRNRHWAQISDVTNLPINQNEGLTWHWIIESGIESKITEIASISRSANFEYTIEKALTDMIDQIRSLSVELTKDKGHTRMKDTTHIFKVLSDHQVRIQELFVPPYIKPFMMKIKEYEFLANNLRQILNRTLDAQNAIDDLAPAMESQDIRTQNQNVSANYDETVRIFNRLVSKFGDARQFHDLVSNPKYFSIIDDVQGNISVLKEDLDKVIEQKRKIFPHFRYLSDSQLIQLISFSQSPEKFCTLFGSIYSGIEQGTAVEDSEKKKFVWVGFRSIDGEIVKFNNPFENTPESVETIFENFDNAITNTLTTICFNLLKKQTTNINKIVSSYPTQIVCLVYQIFFSQNVHKIFESADIIFSERKVQFLNDQFTNLLNFIQTDINYLAEAARSEPTISISNLVTVLIKQRDIINELISEKVVDSTSYHWTRHLRFSAHGTSEVGKFKVIATCGFNSYEYGFNYTGGGPLPFVTDSNEQIYGSFMTNLSNNFNSIVTGDISSFKTTFITSFANLLGKSVFVYNCSSENSSEMILSLINTSSLTNYFLILRDFGMLKSSVVSDLTPSITNFAKKKKKLNFALFATYPAVSISEPLPPHIRLLFRHVTLLPPDTNKVIETFLTGIGFSPNLNESLNSINYNTTQNAKLLKQLITVADSLSIVADPKSSALFSVRNIMNTIAKKPLDKENPSLDVCKRLISQVKKIGNKKSDLIEDLLSIFEVDNSIINDSNIERRDQIPTEFIPSSKEVQKCLETFIDVLQVHRDIIILGKTMTGKTTVIKTAAKLQNKNYVFINPNAQSYHYLSSNKEKGLLYDAVQNSEWIVFDSEISDSWMNILAVSMVRRDHLYFNDGCGMKIPELTRFIYETDSLSNATPSILTYCATIVFPSKSVTYKDLISKFLNKIQNDERIIEPVSGKLFGTQIQMSSFIDKAEKFLTNILSYLCENLEFSSFSEIQSVNNFFEVLESMLTVHYYSNTKFDVFDQQNLSQIYDDLENIVVFACIWSFGATTIDDERKRFEETIKSFLEQNNMSIDIINTTNNGNEEEDNEVHPQNISLFDIYYNTTKQKWKLWEDIGFNKFYSSPTTMTDICPEYLILDEKTIVSSLYLTNLLISQGRNLLIESSNEKYSNIVMHLSIYTEFIGSHFSQHCYQFPTGCSNHVIRNMVDQCLSGIRDGSRSTSRLPLLALLGMDLNQSKYTELLRYILDNGFVLNLNTFTQEVTTSMSFLITSTIKDNVNDRLLSHLAVLRIPEVTEIEGIIGQAIETLCGIPKSTEVASIITNKIYEMTTTVQFNVFHILKLIQRVAMVMNGYPKSYFLNALSYESVSIFYDFTKSEETVEILNGMLTEISETIEIDRYDPISEHLNTKFLSNLRSLKFRPISSLDEISTSNSEMASMIHSKRKRLIKHQSSLGDIRQIFSHGKYIDNFNGLSVCFESPKLSMFDQQNVLRLERLITTPKTHILINTKSSLSASELALKTVQILNFNYSVYQTGQSLISLIHDSFIKAGKLEQHVVLLVNEPFLNKSDFELVYLMTKSSDIYTLLGPNEMLSIMSELHCRDGEEDPFHEDTLESNSNYHLLVRDFIGNCNNYFHLLIVSNEESPNFEALFDNCSTLTISMPLQPLIRQTLKTNVKCKLASQILSLLSDEITSNREIPLLNSISSFNENLLEKVMDKFQERFEVLLNLTTICTKTEESIQNHLDKLFNMEKQIQQIAAQIESMMEQANKNIESSQKEREEIEKEEKILLDQQLQAEKLRKESEESLSITKPLMMQSTQELRMLSSRDISVIKTMNHPPRGVFLVVRSIVLIMGYQIEDKNDDPNANQPSWILGKKILSDTSFLSNLMKQALENLSDETLNKLKKYMEDPNFSPSVVASSSTAAKSICQYVRAIVPYYNALKNFEEKQKQLKICEENLKSLQKKHDIAAFKLQSAAKEVEEFEQKTKNLKLNKERIELQLNDQKLNCEKYQNAMQLMNDFFNVWKDEMKSMNNKKDEMEMKNFFIAVCLALFGSFDLNRRDELFETTQKVFIENGVEIGIKSRMQLMEAINNVVRINENEFGVRDPIHLIENLALFTISKNNWFFVIDSDNMIISILKPVVLKRIVITSFISSEFNNDLLNALLGNDLLVVYDYQWETKFPVFNEIFESRGKDIEIFGKKVAIPIDFQIVFIVGIFPDFPVFDSVLIENVATDEEIANDVASKLFTSLDPENSHDSINTVKTLKEAHNELKRTQNELENLLIQNSDTCLNDEKVSRQFQNASKIKGRIIQQIEKLESVKSEYLRHYEDLKAASVDFVDLYHNIELRDGLNHFYDALIDELTSTKFNNMNITNNNNNAEDLLMQKLKIIYNNLRRHLYSKKAISIRFDGRVKMLCKTINIKTGQYEDTINQISNEFGSESLCQPSTIPQIIDGTSSRRPVLLNCSYFLLKYLTMNDKTIVSSAYNLLSSYNEALSSGKMLATVLTDFNAFPNIISIISKIRTANSLSSDFRFFVFIDYDEDAQEYPSQMLAFCDIIDFNTILNVRRKMSIEMSSLNLTLYDSPIPNKTTFWRRVLFLLSFFDASANLMTQTIFQNQQFNEENFDLMVDYLKSIENPMFENIGHLFINTFYAVEQPQILSNLIKIWKNIFGNQANFNDSKIIFDNDSNDASYKVPLNYAPVNVSEIIEQFPVVDNSTVFGFESDSDAHFKHFTEQKWINSKFGKMDFTSIELKSIDVSNVVWYLKFEAEEVNKRFLLQHHRFTRGLRKLLNNLRCSVNNANQDKNPPVDLSVMFNPFLFFSLLKHKYLINSINQNSFNILETMKTIGFLLTNEPPANQNDSRNDNIEIENLTIINASYDASSNIFKPEIGSRLIPTLYIKVIEVDDECLKKVPLYHQGMNICDLYIKASPELNCESVLILTAFTDSTK